MLVAAANQLQRFNCGRGVKPVGWGLHVQRLAVTRVVLYQGETRVQFEAEPTAFRWNFYRQGDQVWVQLLHLANGALHDKAGTQIWSSWQTVGTVARAVIRAFDDLAAKHGTSRYHDEWGHPFPIDELEKLRTAWRQYKLTADF